MTKVHVGRYRHQDANGHWYCEEPGCGAVVWNRRSHDVYHSDWDALKHLAENVARTKAAS